MADELQAGRVGRDVPVEPAPEIPGLEEVVHPGLHVLVIEDARIVGPVAQEVPDVELAGSPAGADQVGGPWQLMERLVPDLPQVVGVRPAPADTRIGAVEEEEPRQPLGMRPGEGLGDVGTDVMADDSEPPELERIGEAQDVPDVVFEPVALLRRHVRLVGRSEATQVGGDHVVPAAQRLDHLAPDTPELRPAVQQHQREAVPLADVVHGDPVGPQVVVAEIHGRRMAYGMAPVDVSPLDDEGPEPGLGVGCRCRGTPLGPGVCLPALDGMNVGGTGDAAFFAALAFGGVVAAWT